MVSLTSLYEYRFNRIFALFTEFNLFNKKYYKNQIESYLEPGVKLRFHLLNKLLLAADIGIAFGGINPSGINFPIGVSIELDIGKFVIICMNAKTFIVPDYGYWLSAVINYKIFYHSSFNALPTPEGKQRSFIFISKGRYETLIDTTNLNKLTKENSDIEEIEYEYALFQNYPNPFNPSTIIKYQLKEAGEVTVKLYDVLGNEVYTLVNEYKEKGLYEVNFNSSVLSSGVYFCIIKSKEFTATRKMILMR